VFADVDLVTRECLSRGCPNVRDTAFKYCGNRLYAAEPIGPRPFVQVHDTAVIAANSEGDRGERTNDALIGPTESFEITPGTRRNSPRIVLIDDFGPRACRECNHLSGRGRGYSETGIAALDKEVPHLLTHATNELVARDVVAMRQLDGCRAVPAGEWHTRIEKQLMPADDRTPRSTAQPPDDLACELVRARAANDVSVVDADVDHA
jgi:hypothetical protein